MDRSSIRSLLVESRRVTSQLPQLDEAVAAPPVEHPSMGFFIKVPEAQAKAFPKRGGGEDNSPPHVTVLYLGKSIPEDRVQEVLVAGQKAVGRFKARDLFYGGLGYFEAHTGKTIAHSLVHCTGLDKIHWALWEGMLRAGLPIQRSYPDFIPHMTLDYRDDREYTGKTPSGDFRLEMIEVWREDDVVGQVYLSGQDD